MPKPIFERAARRNIGPSGPGQVSYLYYLRKKLSLLTGAENLHPSEVVAKIPAPEKLMILASLVRVSLLTRAVLTNAYPVGWARRNGNKGRQKGGFAGTGIFASASSGRSSSITFGINSTLQLFRQTA